MKPNWKILQAMQYCPYKAWQLSREHYEESAIPWQLPAKISAIDKLALSAYAIYQQDETGKAITELDLFSENGLPLNNISVKPSPCKKKARN